MTNKLWTYPRILVDSDLHAEALIDLSAPHVHYFKTVLRRSDGDYIRLFNTRDGEWLGELCDLSKKSGAVRLLKQTRSQDEGRCKTSLFFAPIKKARMEFLLEKTVELGVTDFHPIITARTEKRVLKRERIEAQIVEAAEQCERLTVPIFHDEMSLRDLVKFKGVSQIYACIERDDERDAAPFLSDVKGDNFSFLVGPEGGFTDEEIAVLSECQHVKAISLGDRIYRAETASILCLSHAALLRDAVKV